MLCRRVPVMAVVVLLHGLVLAFVWLACDEIPRRDDVVLQVELFSPPAPAREPRNPAPLPVRLTVPMHDVLIDHLPAVRIAVAEEAPVSTAKTAPAPTVPDQAITPMLGAELAVQCPDRTAPRYPVEAKRRREQGEVRLRVELDESGRIDSVSIVESSGSPRLDQAARTAIESWHCRPAQKDGHAVRAVALQSLDFVLERR